MNKNQTALEWYAIEEINLTIDYTQGKISQLEYAIKRLDILEQAKQMEKEQIAKAWDDGDYAYFYSKETGRDFENGEEYYKTKFCNNEQ